MVFMMQFFNQFKYGSLNQYFSHKMFHEINEQNWNCINGIQIDNLRSSLIISLRFRAPIYFVVYAVLVSDFPNIIILI